MTHILYFLLSFLTSTFRSRLSLQLEVAALRHQLSAYRLKGQRPRIAPELRQLIQRMWRSNPTWGQIALCCLANVSRSALERPCRYRLLCRANGDIQSIVRFRRLGTRSPENCPPQRDGTSDRTVDSPADCGSVSIRYGPAVSVARRRWHIW